LGHALVVGSFSLTPTDVRVFAFGVLAHDHEVDGACLAST
jgi:hypothetical protein